MVTATDGEQRLKCLPLLCVPLPEKRLKIHRLGREIRFPGQAYFPFPPYSLPYTIKIHGTRCYLKCLQPTGETLSLVHGWCLTLEHRSGIL